MIIYIKFFNVEDVYKVNPLYNYQEPFVNPSCLKCGDTVHIPMEIENTSILEVVSVPRTQKFLLDVSFPTIAIGEIEVQVMDISSKFVPCKNCSSSTNTINT
jgi:hypothetical protein